MHGSEVRLARRPVGSPTPDAFEEVVEVEVPEPAPGEVLVRNRLISFDPGLRWDCSAASTSGGWW
jgi:NADPH-dependent curcumin reductase CurA